MVCGLFSSTSSIVRPTWYKHIHKLVWSLTSDVKARSLCLHITSYLFLAYFLACISIVRVVICHSPPTIVWFHNGFSINTRGSIGFPRFDGTPHIFRRVNLLFHFFPNCTTGPVWHGFMVNAYIYSG